MAKFEFNTPVGKGAGEYKIKDGLLHIYAQCPEERGYIYRLSFTSETGQSHIAGVMLPNKGKFVISKASYSFNRKLWECSAIRASVIRSIPGESRMLPLPFNYSALHPLNDRSIIADKSFAEIIGCDMLFTEYEGLLYLFFPIVPGAECRYSSVFCITTPIFYKGSVFGALVYSQGKLSPIPTPRTAI